MKSLYIHIPFCDQICHYCDFPKRVATEELKEKYIDYLLQEYSLYDIPTLETIYIGGGTPSSLSLPLIKKLLSRLPKVSEMTFECNPNDINEGFLTLLKTKGVTRISLGVQTFNNDLLKKIGRKHSKKEADDAINLIQDFGFSLSVDMIFNLPGQDESMLRYDICSVFAYRVEHVSYYSLILEPNTVFEKWIEKGKLEVPENDEYFYDCVMYEFEEFGYEQYEISNFTLGRKSLHNLTYWNNEEYIGLGLAASGYVDGERYSNVRMFTEYFELLDSLKKPIALIDQLSLEDKMYEHLMLGFRKLEGVDIEEFDSRYGTSIFKAFPELKNLVSEGFLETESGRIKVTKKGLFFNNDMLVRLL